jgi:hypothetical protein
LIGQARLFDRGYDSERVHAEDPALARFRARLRQREEGDITPLRDGMVSLSRERAARFLKELGDPLATQLIGFGNAGNGLAVVERNRSILIHGFGAVAPDDGAQWQRLFAKLQDLLDKDGGGSGQSQPWVSVARMPGLE